MCGVSSLWQLDKEVGGTLIPSSMQRVSKCKLVGLCGAAARRRAAKISRSPFRRFLIANGITIFQYQLHLIAIIVLQSQPPLLLIVVGQSPQS
jgi:hypothetical protein